MQDGTVNVDVAAQGAQTTGQSSSGEQGQQQQPVRYGNVAETDLQDALRHFGVSLDDVKSYPTLKSEYANLMAKANEPKFATPVIELLNNLAAEGKGADAMVQALRIQSMDLSSLSNMEVIKQQMLLNDPLLDSITADAILAKRFPELAEGANESDRKLREYEMRQAAEVAKAELQKMQAGLQVQRQVDPQVEQQKLLLQRGWSDLYDKIGETIAIRDKYDDGEFQLDYKPNLPANVAAQIKQHVTQYAVQNNLKFDEAGMKAMQTYRENLLILADPAQYRRAIIKDIEASVREATVRAFHNPSGYSEQPAQGSAASQSQPQGIKRPGGMM